MFAGAFLAAVSLLAPWRQAGEAADARIERLKPFMFAALVGYCFGLLTLSRQFVGPTYLMLGMSVAVYHVGRNPSEIPRPVNAWFFAKIAAGGAVGLLCLHLAIRVLVRW